jgi:hypothetical protein
MYYAINKILMIPSLKQPSHRTAPIGQQFSIEYPMLLQTPANNAYNMDPSSANRGAQS